MPRSLGLDFIVLPDLVSFFSHNEQSLEKLVSEVAEKTGVELSIEVSVVGSTSRAKPQDSGDWLYLNFSITSC